MFGLLLVVLLVVIAAGAASFFHKKLVDIVPNDNIRWLITALFFLGIIIGLPWLGASLLFGDMYPVSTHKINAEYSFTQQSFGFATTTSQGYDLTLYQHRRLWFNKELGAVRLECAGDENISFSVINGPHNVNRIIIKASREIALDTTFSFDKPFNIQHAIIN